MAAGHRESNGPVSAASMPSSSQGLTNILGIAHTLWLTVVMPTAAVYRAIADPSRRHLLDELRAEPIRAGDLGAALPISQSALSQHLRVLRDAGLVDVDRHGRERWYRLTAEPLEEVAAWVSSYQRFWADALIRLGDHLDHRAAPMQEDDP